MIQTELLLSQITKPSDIFLAITYPLEKNHFLNDISPSVNKEFAKNRRNELFPNKPAELSWDLYIHQTALDIKSFCQFVKEKGGEVKINFTLSDFKLIMGYKVILIQAHFNEDEKTIELFDGKYPIEEIQKAIPINFKGIFDLTVCQSDFLAYSIKKKFHDNCFILQNLCKTTLQVRLPIWKTIIKILEVASMNYTDADKLVRSEIIKKMK